MKFFSKAFIYSLLLISFSNYAQKSTIDSLTRILTSCKEDTSKINLLNLLAELQRNSNPDTCIYFANKALALSAKLNYKPGEASAYIWIGTAETNYGNYDLALKKLNNAKIILEFLLSQKTEQLYKSKLLLSRALNNMGNIYWRKGNYSEALKYHRSSLKIKTELGNKQGIADSYNNIGNIFIDAGNYPEALKNHFKALHLREELKNISSVADSYNNIGNIYFKQVNLPEALKYYSNSLQIKKELGDEKGIASAYGNLANVYSGLGDESASLKNNLEALKINEKFGDKDRMATNYNNIGTSYRTMGDFTNALKNHFISLHLKEEIGDEEGICSSCSNIGLIYVEQKKPNEAIRFLNRCVAISSKIMSKEDLMIAYNGLFQADSLLGNSKQMLSDFKLYIHYKDSLFNEENTKKQVRTEMNFEFDKKEAEAKLEQEKREAVATAESNKQKVIIWSVCGILVLVFSFAVFAYRSYLQKQKANIAIIKQKHLIEEKQKEILDSIYYARRIQRSLLPQENMIYKILQRLNG